MYEQIIVQSIKMLSNLSKLFEKAKQYAETKKFDANIFLTLRLAPDQFTFARQIQIACDGPKRAAAFLCGKEPPKNEDTEQTFKELEERIRFTIDYLKTFKPEDFNGCEQRAIPIAFMPGKYLLGAEYARELVVPNFYFHITTAYSILRNNGVDVGKSDYIGTLNFKDL